MGRTSMGRTSKGHTYVQGTYKGVRADATLTRSQTGTRACARVDTTPCCVSLRHIKMPINASRAECGPESPSLPRQEASQQKELQCEWPTRETYGELDKLEGPQYAARRAELRREAREAARARDQQAAVALQNEAEESGATEEEATGGRTTRVGRPRGGMRVAARIGDRLRREIGRGRRPRVGDG